MDIVEFLQQSSGNWFSQRTSHYLLAKQTRSGKADLMIEMLQKDDPAVVALCQQYQDDRDLALGGLRVSWEGAMEPDGKKQKGSTVLVPLANADNPNAGKLLCATGGATDQAMSGRYVLGNDEVLTLIIESDALYSEERLWFASPNLRFRTSVVKQADGFSEASFCSEIRRVATAAQPSQANSSAAAQ